MRVPGGGAGATVSSAWLPVSSKRSPRRSTGPLAVTAGRKVCAIAGAAAASAPDSTRDAAIRLMASVDLSQGCFHVVRGLDHLRVHLVGALRRDEIGDLGDDIDVRGLEIA